MARFENYTTGLALVLALIAAIATAPSSVLEASQKMELLLLVTTASEAISTSGAVGGAPTFPVSP